jgi:hypothetical protein
VNKSIAKPLSVPVLITGLPRSGSSWVGEVLARRPGVRYRYESLNQHWVPQLRGTLGHFRYQRPGTPGGKGLRAAVDGALKGKQSARQLLRAFYRGYPQATLRPKGRLLLKDPTACLLAAWIESQRDVQVVLLVRHPCGFASSVHALQWPFHLQRMLTQRPLLEDHLDPFRGLLEQCLKDPWASLGGFWAATHLVLQAQAGPGWITAHYEQLCARPQTAFETLAADLGLARTAVANTRPVAAADTDTDPGSTRRNSGRMAMIWRERMSNEEINSVMEVVERFGLVDFATAGMTQDEA